MSKIIFNTGKEMEFPTEEWDKQIQRFKTNGLRIQMLFLEDNMIAVPLNSNNIERIERGEPYKRETPAEIIAEEKIKMEVPDQKKAKVEKKETDQERNDRLLKIMMEKSDCKHEAEKLVLNVQETKNGPRYFHVCSFCGHRNRYEKKGDLVAAGFDLDTAIKWTDS